MYKIIGNDGKTYGPVAAAQIREWIAQGRVENRTAVLRDGAADWTFLGLLPEFAPYFPGPPPAVAPPKIGAPPARRANGFATAGFVCGLVCWFTCCCCGGFPFNLLGLVFSTIALVEIGRQTEKEDGWGLALAGLICSAASLLFSFGCGLFQLLNTPANLAWHFGAM